MGKRGLKFLVLAFLVAGSSLVLIYAQKGFFRDRSIQKNESSETIESQSETEEIGVVTGDDPWVEMEQLVGMYYPKGGATFKGTIKLIDDNGAQEKVLEKHDFQYSSFGPSSSYSIAGLEVVQKPNLTVIADTRNQIITVSLSNSSVIQSQGLFDINLFRKTMEERSAEAVVTTLGAEKILTIDNIQDPQIQGYRIYYDTATMKINKMLIGMIRLSPLEETSGEKDLMPELKSSENESEFDATHELNTYTYYMEISYSEIKMLSLTADQFKPENKFISITKSNISLNPAYSGYQLIINKNDEK